MVHSVVMPEKSMTVVIRQHRLEQSPPYHISHLNHPVTLHNILVWTNITPPSPKLLFNLLLVTLRAVGSSTLPHTYTISRVKNYIRTASIITNCYLNLYMRLASLTVLNRSLYSPSALFLISFESVKALTSHLYSNTGMIIV